MKLSYDHFQFELDPKDLLFLAVSGSHSYGTYRHDSDLDLRGVVVPQFRDAIRIRGSQVRTVFKKLSPDIDIELVPIRKWLQILLKGNGNYLENLWQPIIYPTTEKLKYQIDLDERWKNIWELQDLVMTYGLSKKFRNHYKGFAISQQDDFYQKYKTKCLLYVYRVLMSGIVLYRDNVVEYNLKRLLKLYPSDYVQMLMDRYDSEQSIMNDKITMDIQKEFDNMEQVLDEWADKSELPDKPDYEPFNRWLEEWYRRELNEKQILDS